MPGFEERFLTGEPDDDPVNMLWRIFQKGSSLCVIFNALQPVVPIGEDKLKTDLDSKNLRKAACYAFLTQIREELGFEGDDSFMISNLWSEDTNGFVKVTKTVSKVIDEIGARGLLIKREEKEKVHDENEDSQPLSQRMRAVQEFVTTERKYVQDLEILQDYMQTLQNSEAASPDLIHNLFLNLNSLLDFQRRFLIRVETVYAQPPHQQRWGQVMAAHEHAFDVYEPYCANFNSAQQLAVQESARLSSVEHPMVAAGVGAFLIKPIQRLCKYPLLLKDMVKSSDKEQIEDLQEGIAAVERINSKVNEAVRKVDNTKVVEDLRTRVDDWKGHRLEQFGALLLNGQFTVIKGEGKGEIEREYQIYLFQKILLCCKEVVPSRRQKNTMSMGKNKAANGKKSSKLLLKGRIFMQNVTDIVWVAGQGNYTLQIFWKGDPGVEDFVIKHRTPDTLNQWKVQLQAQVDLCRQLESGMRSNGSTRNTSSTEFMWMQNSSKEYDAGKSDEDGTEEEEDEVEDTGDGYNPAYGNQHWNDSNLSMRSRSTTNEGAPPAYSSGLSGSLPPPAYSSGVPSGLPSNPRQPRYAHQSQGSINGALQQPPPLTLVTHPISSSPGTQSPNGTDFSYFSPTSETPIGSRGSTSSGAYPFPRQPTPNYHDDPRYPGGAPMSRTASREGSGQPAVSGSRMQRPSLPGMSPGGTMQNRMRSASSPNIHHLPGNGQMGRSSGMIPPVPVPPMPQTYQAYQGGPAIINRSQNSSPASPDGIPSRHASPGVPSGPRLTGSLSKSVQVPQVKVCVQFGQEEFIIIVPFNIPYTQLMDRVERKVRINQNSAHLPFPGNLKVKYQDEDGDLISMSSDDDVAMAFDLVIGGGSNGIVMLFVSP